MAEPAKLQAASAPPTPSRKKGGAMLWIIVAVLAVGGGAGAWFALKPKASQQDAAAEKPAAPRATPVYYKFDPAFVVNFGGEGNARYLQIAVEAMSRNAEVIEDIKNNEPAIRNDLVLLFSSQEYSTLVTSEGKERLRAATLEAIRKTVASEGGDAKLVEAVYFTSFVIQ
jgi:flagellar protein FliL